jgi:hypothetical protein
MKEKTFRVPSVRELILKAGINLEGRVDAKFIQVAFNSGMLRLVDSYAQGVIEVEQIGANKPESGKPLFAVFPETFRIDAEDSRYGIKSLSRLAKIDSVGVLREVAGQDNVPAGFTRQFLEKYGKWPRSYVRRAVEAMSIDEPPIGFYWVGFDGHVRVVTWLRSTTAAEMQVMKANGDFPPAKVLDTTFYGRNLRVRVKSRTELKQKYDYAWLRLPMHKRGDIGQFSDWVNLSCNSNDPDMVFGGELHEKRQQTINLFSAGAIYGFYEAMGFARLTSQPKQFRINPFPIPLDKQAIDFIDNLRLRTFILCGDLDQPSLRVLNKSEIEAFVGARTILRKYNNSWVHWGSRNLGYLYTPE